MAILKRAYNNVIVWQAISKLNSPLASIRLQAMTTLRDCEEDSIWALKIAIQNKNQPNSQIGAAIILHWLGEEKGMKTLVSALKADVPERPEIAPLLEYAFLTIDSGDAVASLQTVWNEIPDWDTRTEVRSCICRIWMRIKNPAVLENLSAQALRFPTLFESASAAFGASALPMLEQMSRDRNSKVRLLSIRVLKQLPLLQSFVLLSVLIEDPVPAVRAEIPEALISTGGAAATVREIAKATEKGLATSAAIKALLNINPPELLPILLSFIENWSLSPSLADRSEMALTQGIAALENSMMLPHQFTPVLLDLISRPTSARILISVAKVFRRHGVGEVVKEALTLHLSSSKPRVREEIAALMKKSGDTFGDEFILFLETCRPQESLLSRLHAVLRAGPDSSQAAAQLVKQVTSWFSRVSKEAAGRLNLVASETMLPDPILSNPRCSEHLKLLLKRSLSQLTVDFTVEDAEESITSAVTALRGFGKLSAGLSKIARKEIVAAIHCSKSLGSISGDAAQQGGDYAKNDVAEMVRLAAAESHMQIYGRNSFATLIEALYSTQNPVRNSAIIALGQFGDPRAIPHLNAMSSVLGNRFAETVQDAIANIKKTNPEIMTLLRGSSALNANPDLLLRPATGASKSAHDLLRPSNDKPR